jgi:hypothetical protein
MTFLNYFEKVTNSLYVNAKYDKKKSIYLNKNHIVTVINLKKI